MDGSISDEDLDRIEARARAALSGPWESWVKGRDGTAGESFIRTGGLDDAAPDMYVSLSYWDDKPPVTAGAEVLDFIAAARQDVPRLVEAIRRLRREPTPRA